MRCATPSPWANNRALMRRHGSGKQQVDRWHSPQLHPCALSRRYLSCACVAVASHLAQPAAAALCSSHFCAALQCFGTMQGPSGCVSAEMAWRREGDGYLKQILTAKARRAGVSPLPCAWAGGEHEVSGSLAYRCAAPALSLSPAGSDRASVAWNPLHPTPPQPPHPTTGVPHCPGDASAGGQAAE